MRVNIGILKRMAQVIWKRSESVFRSARHRTRKVSLVQRDFPFLPLNDHKGLRQPNYCTQSIQHQGKLYAMFFIHVKSKGFKKKFSSFRSKRQKFIMEGVRSPHMCVHMLWSLCFTASVSVILADNHAVSIFFYVIPVKFV